jgi:hypothetical protein
VVAGGDYLMVTKANKQEFLGAVVDPPPGKRLVVVATRDKQGDLVATLRAPIPTTPGGYPDWRGKAGLRGRASHARACLQRRRQSQDRMTARVTVAWKASSSLS